MGVDAAWSRHVANAAHATVGGVCTCVQHVQLKP